MELSERHVRLQTVCLIILSIIAVSFALFWLRPVLIPFILALVFSYILTPVIDFQRKYLKLPRLLAVITTMIFGLAILFLIWLIFSASINQMASNFESYQLKLDQTITKISDSIPSEQTKIRIKEMINPIFERFGQQAGSMLFGTVNSIVRLLSKGVLVIIFLLFLLLGKSSPTEPDGVWGEIQGRIKRYIITKVIISSVTGFLVGAILMFFKIDLALFFGFSAFILNFIPSIGSIIATILPVPVVLVSPDITMAVGIMAIAIPGLIQFSIGNVVEPKIMGDSLDLHPVVILMALIFWGMIWGIVGMLLAAPLTAIMKIIFEKIEVTSPLANLLAGRLSSEPKKS